MEKPFPGVLKKSKQFLRTALKLFLPNYSHRAKHHVIIFSKTRILQRGLNYVQHANTPSRQYSITPVLQYSITPVLLALTYPRLLINVI
jgi:hypothetical protein